MDKKQHGGPRKGAGRKANEEGPRQIVSYTLPPTLAERARAVAKERGISASELVEQALIALLTPP